MPVIINLIQDYKTGEVMTDIKEDDMKINKMEARIKRRSLLKAGAVIAPLAITLHGGAAMAQVASAGRCVETMKTTVKVPVNRLDESGAPILDGDGIPVTDQVDFSPSVSAFTNRNNDDGSPETHWDYILKGNADGMTCLQSFDSAGLPRPL